MLLWPDSGLRVPGGGVASFYNHPREGGRGEGQVGGEAGRRKTGRSVIVTMHRRMIAEKKVRLVMHVVPKETMGVTSCGSWCYYYVTPGREGGGR